MANNEKKTGGISVAEFMAGKNPGYYEQKQTVGGKSYTPDADSLTGEKQTRATAAEKFFGQFGLNMPEISDTKRDAILAKEDAEKAHQKYYNIYNRNKSATNVVAHKAHGEDWKQQEYDAYVEYLKAQQRQAEAEEANWAEVEQSTDFAQAVEKGRTAYAKWAYQQDNKNFLGNVKESAWKMGARIANMDPNYNRPDARWSQQEWNRFYMYMGTDESRAWKYAAQVNDKYNAQQIEAEKQNVRDTMKWDDNNLANWAKANLGFWSGIVNDPFNIYDYLTTLGQTAIMGEPHRRGHATLADIFNTASESQASQMQKDLHFDESIPFIGGKGAGDAFQLAQSIVKSGMYAYLGRGMGDYPVIGKPTTLLMGGGAANQTYQNAKARGASEWQALALGGIEGLVEAATEKYSIEALLADPKNLAVFIAKQAFTEGSEEIAATVLDSFADSLVMRDKSEFNQAVYMYMANGLSPEDAKKRAYIDWAVGATWDFVGGALSGGVSAGAMSAGTNITNRSARDVNGSGAPTSQYQTAGNNTNSVNAPVNVLGDLTLDTPYAPNEHSLVDLLSEVKTEQQLEKALDKIEDSPELAEAFYDLSGMEVDEYREKHQSGQPVQPQAERTIASPYLYGIEDERADWLGEPGEDRSYWDAENAKSNAANQREEIRSRTASNQGDVTGVDFLIGDQYNPVRGQQVKGKLGSDAYIKQQLRSRKGAGDLLDEIIEVTEELLEDPSYEQYVLEGRGKWSVYSEGDRNRIVREAKSHDYYTRRQKAAEMDTQKYDEIIDSAAIQIQEDGRNATEIADGQGVWAAYSPAERAMILSEATGWEWYVSGNEVVRAKYRVESDTDQRSEHFYEQELKDAGVADIPQRELKLGHALAESEFAGEDFKLSDREEPPEWVGRLRGGDYSQAELNELERQQNQRDAEKHRENYERYLANGYYNTPRAPKPGKSGTVTESEAVNHLVQHATAEAKLPINDPRLGTPRIEIRSNWMQRVMRDKGLLDELITGTGKFKGWAATNRLDALRTMFPDAKWQFDGKTNTISLPNEPAPKRSEGSFKWEKSTEKEKKTVVGKKAMNGGITLEDLQNKAKKNGGRRSAGTGRIVTAEELRARVKRGIDARERDLGSVDVSGRDSGVGSSDSKRNGGGNADGTPVLTNEQYKDWNDCFTDLTKRGGNPIGSQTAGMEAVSEHCAKFGVPCTHMDLTKYKVGNFVLKILGYSGGKGGVFIGWGDGSVKNDVVNHEIMHSKVFERYGNHDSAGPLFAMALKQLSLDQKVLDGCKKQYRDAYQEERSKTIYGTAYKNLSKQQQIFIDRLINAEAFGDACAGNARKLIRGGMTMAQFDALRNRCLDIAQAEGILTKEERAAMEDFLRKPIRDDYKAEVDEERGGKTSEQNKPSDNNAATSSQKAAGTQQNVWNTDTAEQPVESRTEAPAELNSQQQTDTQPKPANRVKDKVDSEFRAKTAPQNGQDQQRDQKYWEWKAEALRKWYAEQQQKRPEWLADQLKQYPEAKRLLEQGKYVELAQYHDQQLKAQKQEREQAKNRSTKNESRSAESETQKKPSDKVPASIRALPNEYQSDEAARNKAAEERGGIDVEAEDFDVEDNSPRQQESERPRRETAQKVMPKSEGERIQQREDARRAEEEEYMREYHPEEYERNQGMQRREDQRAKDEAEYKGKQSNPAEPESSREYRSKPQREARKAADKAAANEEAQRNAERDREQEEAEYREAQAKEREAQQKETFGEEVYEKLKKLSKKLGDRIGAEHVASSSPGTYTTKSGETKRSGVSDVYQVFSPNPGGYYIEPFVHAAQGLVTGESSMADVARAYHELSLDETKGSYFYDKSIDKALRKLNDSLNGQKISPDVADRIVKVLQMADHRIGRMQAMLKSRPDIAKAFDAQNLTPKEKKSLRKALEWAKREQLRPDVAFEMLGGHDSKNGAFFYGLSKQVKDSVKNFTNIFQTANDYVQPLTQHKDFGKFASGKITVKNVIPGLRNENYGSTISANMAVSFLKTLETNGAIDHIIRKGIVEMPRSEKEYISGDNNKGFGNGQNGYSFIFDPISEATREELNNATKAKDREAARAKAEAEMEKLIRDLHREINKVEVAKLAYDTATKPIRYLARAANKTARTLYGVDIATQGDSYWSLFAGGEHTAGELLNGDAFGMNEQRNMQERTGDSGGLRIMSFTDTLDMIMQTEAHWAAFQELSDTLDILSREFTDKEHVKDSLTDQIMHNGFGKEWVEWLQNYENDINGMAREGDQFASAFIGKLRSNIAQSSLTFNPSVALKQTPSGLNYMSVIDPDIVAKRFFTGKFKIMRSYMNNALVQTVEKHTRVLASRRSGLDVMGIDTENASQRKGLIGKVSSFLSKPGSTWITRQDVKTVANGMLACADQVDRWIKHQKPGYENLKKGSYEYYEAIADLFEEATIRTQPIYNREFRAEQFRTNNEIIRSLSMFRTQPSQNYNNMVQALGELNAAKRSGDAETIKNARKRLAATSTGLVTSAISFAVLDTAMKLALRKWKQYRDKDGELDEGIIGAKTAYTFLNSLFSTSWPASLISPFAIDATTGLLNKANGNIPKSGLWNGTQESGLSLVNDFQESLKSFTENPTLKTGKALALATASMTGVPARNWYNMLNAAFLWGIDAIPATRGANYNNEDDIINAIYAYCSAKPNSRGKQAMRMALNMAREGNPDAKEYILSTLDWSDEELVKGAKAELAEQFKLGQIGEARYRDILERYFKEDDDAVDKLVNAGNSAKEYNAAVERAKAKNSSYDQVSANLDKLNSDSDPTGEKRFKMISDLDLDDKDTDTFISHHMSSGYTKNYLALRESGFSPDRANQILQEIDTDTGGDQKFGISQAEVYAYSLTSPGNARTAKELWAARVSSGDWVKSFDKYEESYKKDPVNILMGYGMSEGSAKSVMKDMNTDGKGVTQAEFYAYYKAHPAQQEALRAVWATKWPKSDFNAYAKKHG